MYYAPRSYQSGDADFIITFSIDTTCAGNALRELGYDEIGGTYHYDKEVTMKSAHGASGSRQDLGDGKPISCPSF